MATKRPKVAPHRHDWQDQHTRNWRYVCAICGGKSRNNLVQLSQFREPLRMTSVVLIGPEAGRVITSIIHPDGSITTEPSERSAGDGE